MDERRVDFLSSDKIDKIKNCKIALAAEIDALPYCHGLGFDFGIDIAMDWDLTLALTLWHTE